ncbi:protein kinase domain-containing protein [Aliivibrio fischeri]|uniref:non-specific serine/threonine protein kinase n=1 Tax=Aliivibrio fischeri TaxID=668 RepID=A0A510UN96_ALIFS|nr:protein kinase [Aliivibrio fischeri]GEK15936.1 hypothetical protein AFI02nite_39720 [Aliivibrio fischeri]
MNFHHLDDVNKKAILERTFPKLGKCIKQTAGMCGDIYVFDQGEYVVPRFVCAKIPKPLSSSEPTEINKRFVKELGYQVKWSEHIFVHWAFDFNEILGTPLALFRYWDGDLDSAMIIGELDELHKLSIMSYVCSGLSHCYNNGLICHQDLKPANIFIRDAAKQCRDLPDLNIYKLPLVADFGLANAFYDSAVYAGTRPYMAPEQWNEKPLSSKTDVFALGVILYELMSGGLHPVGIKLRDFWPVPLAGESKKWTGSKPWKKWSTKETDKIKNINSTLVDSEVIDLIKLMLNQEPDDRPSINEVLDSLLEIIKLKCEKSYVQIEFLINHYNEEVSGEALSSRWPHLFVQWEKFSGKFG